LYEVFERHDIKILKGAIDIHVHAAPDLYARSLNAIELAKQAAMAGMRAIVLKCHFFPTVFMAYLAKKVISNEIDVFDVFGGIVLNHYVGGLNPYAVEAAIKAGGKIVWMPTISAENHIKYFEKAKKGTWLLKGKKLKSAKIGISPLSKKGELVPEMEEILNIIADTNTILATGHLSAHEIEILVEEAKNLGVKKILINHPIFSAINMPVEKQKEIAKKGAYMEYVFVAFTPLRYSIHPEEVVKMIKEVGIERSIIATDLGQIDNPSPVEGLRTFIQILLETGLKPNEVRSLVTENPANLLNIKVRKYEV